LPAICEMSYDSGSSGTGCGTSSTPLVQNMQSNLVDNLVINAPSGYYWSATESSGNPQILAWLQYFAGGGSDQLLVIKDITAGVRCVRALTD
ncbi:MAG TPA: hypothetical protein VK715_06705, partial [Steroidobacteraceae bacterium]|nr:hypothetical protein [Steroidobacteraceae bacterium]